MTRFETEGVKYPVDVYGVDITTLPPHQRSVFHELRPAAIIGGELYALQRTYLKTYSDHLTEDEKASSWVQNPFTIPTEDREFVYFWQHHAFEGKLREAESIIMSAARRADESGETELAQYLRLAGVSLVNGSVNQATEEYMKLRSALNFNLLPLETDNAGGLSKRMFQGYLGIADADETRMVSRDIQALREAGIARNGGAWFTPRTDMRVDHVNIMSGWLGSEAHKSSESDSNDGFSATNQPNETDQTRKFGTRITIFSASLDRALNQMKKTAAPFTDAKLLPTRRGVIRTIAGHEIMHDERYSNRAGDFQGVLRESYATVAGLDLSADVWDPEAEATPYETVARGLHGFSTRDVYSILQNQDNIPDLGTLASKSIYMPISLALEYLSVQEGGFIVENGIIVAMDLKKIHDLSRRLADEQQKLLQFGTEQDVRDHFEGILPKRAFLVRNSLNTIQVSA
jgi:hypothetical protein